MKKQKQITPALTAETEIKVRFSEVDSMGVVWHGSYPLYFEDARESFGEKFGLQYQTIYDAGYFAPLVELNFSYKKPLRHGDTAKIIIGFIPVAAAKIVFQYTIINPSNGDVYATGESIQVFMDHEYNLVWDNPPFYKKWKEANGIDDGI